MGIRCKDGVVLVLHASNRITHLVFGLRLCGLLLLEQIRYFHHVQFEHRYVVRIVRCVHVRISEIEFIFRFLVAGSREANLIQNVTRGLQPQNSCCGPSCWHGKFVRF